MIWVNSRQIEFIPKLIYAIGIIDQLKNTQLFLDLITTYDVKVKSPNQSIHITSLGVGEGPVQGSTQLFSPK